MQAPLFISPDLIKHVYSRWTEGTADEKVTRSFGIQDSRKAPQFVMMGGRAAVQYIKDWTLASHTPWLRQLPSLASLPDEFWDYIAGLRVRGNMKAVPDGTRFDTPVGASEELREREGDGAFDLPLIELTDVAATVALASPGILAFVDAQVGTGVLIFNDHQLKGPPVFWMAERTNHPLWGRINAEVEAVFGSDPLKQLQQRIVYVAVDPAITPPESRCVAGESTVEHNHRPVPNAYSISTRSLRDRLHAEVHLLWTEPRNIKVRLLGDPDVATEK